MDHLNELRRKIDSYFDPANKIPDEDEHLVSPSRRYCCDVSAYRLDVPGQNWQVARAIVRERSSGAEIARIICEDDRFWHCWLERDDGAYLLCAESLGGQTTIDLTTGAITSYHSADDEFIWTERYPAPGQRRLAVIGCYWAWPFELRVYDCAQPLSLPLRQTQAEILLGPSEEFGGWLSDSSFRLISGDGSTRVIDCGP